MNKIHAGDFCLLLRPGDCRPTEHSADYKNAKNPSHVFSPLQD